MQNKSPIRRTESLLIVILKIVFAFCAFRLSVRRASGL